MTEIEIKQHFYIAYQVNKAIRYVKKRQGDVSEVKDELAAGIATEVHHIFPKSQFPQISSFFENLILLTGSQHRQKAHPNGNTQFARILTIKLFANINKFLVHKLQK